MARLPVPGGDQGVWAELLNEYLRVTHNDDGTQKADSISGAALQSRSVGLRHIRTANQTATPVTDFILSNTGNELIWKLPDAVLPQGRSYVFNVATYGAIGDGITDDTDAIQTAIDAAVNGGSVVFPPGTFMVRSLKIARNGVTLTGAARLGTRIVRLGGTQPLVDLSGKASASLSEHIKYCTITSIMLSGNNLPGLLLRSYYADNCTYRDVSFVHTDGVATEFIEVWDSRFQDCSWEDCGNFTQPALLLHNSLPQGQFGYSTDTTNQIHFEGCRWESWCNGAVRLDGSDNGSQNRLNGIFFVSCKMETRHAAGSALQIQPGTTIVFVNQLYIAIMGRDPSYSTRIDAITDRGSQVFMSDVYTQWGSVPGMAGAVLHIWEGNPHTYEQISSFFPLVEDDVPAFAVLESPSARVMLLGLWANQQQRKRIDGLLKGITVGGPAFGYMYPIGIAGVFRVLTLATNKDILRVDNSSTQQLVSVANSADLVGYADTSTAEKWRIAGTSGAARFAGGKFQIEPTKGYIGVNTVPYSGLGMLLRLGADTDRGLAVVRSSAAATGRLLEFQDETYNLQGTAFDCNGRPIVVGTPARVTPGSQVSYANPGIQTRDCGGNVRAAVKPSPTAPGAIAQITFSRPYATAPLSISITNHSAVEAGLYVSQRSAAGFTVSTRATLPGGSLLEFDYAVLG